MCSSFDVLISQDRVSSYLRFMMDQSAHTAVLGSGTAHIVALCSNTESPRHCTNNFVVRFDNIIPHFLVNDPFRGFCRSSGPSISSCRTIKLFRLSQVRFSRIFQFHPELFISPALIPLTQALSVFLRPSLQVTFETFALALNKQNHRSELRFCAS